MGLHDLRLRLRQLQAAGLTAPEQEWWKLTDEPKFPAFHCSPGECAAVRYGVQDCSGHGFAESEEMARVRAVAETLERICLRAFLPPEIPHRAFHPNGGDADPALFIPWCAEESPPRSGEIDRVRGAVRSWVLARDILDGRDIWLPAQLISLNGRFQQEPPLGRERNSSGAALGMAGRNEALRSAVFELIERDAVLSAYLQRRPLPRIAALPARLQALTEYIERYELEVHLFDAAGSLGVPVVLALAIDRTGGGPAVNTGACAAETYSAAILHAVMESLQSRPGLRLQAAERLAQPPPAPAEVRALDDRGWFWYPVESIAHLSFWLGHGGEVPYRKLARRRTSLDDLIENLRRRNCHLFAADLTLPEVREAGFEVVKAVVPELQPLYLDESNKTISSAHHGVIPGGPALPPHPFL